MKTGTAVKSIAMVRLILAAAMLVLLGLSGCAAPQLRPADNRLLGGRTYVVTGASSGFGRGVAERLGAGRANVVLAARRTELLEEVAARIRASGGQALVVTTDVGKPEEIERLAAAAVQRFGRIDVWVNNAAVSSFGRFWEVPVADYSRIVDTNFKGVIYGSHAALRRFRVQGGGVLINIGSVESEVPVAYHAVYAATKAAVLGLGRAINEELRLSGLSGRIKAVTVMPWAADTPFFPHAGNYTGHQPRMIMLDDPRRVAEAIVWASLHPREELPVGWKAQGAVTAHRLFPDLTERVAADIQHREFQKGSPAPSTSGNVHRPMEEGRDVVGGVRQRMKREDQARRRRQGS